MPTDDTDTIFINEEEEGIRLDKVLAHRFHGVQSRTYFQFLIEEGRILLNGVPTKKRVKPVNGDEVEIHYILTPEIDLTPEPIPLQIIYEDSDLLVINKPSGMVVHPAPGHWTGTFVNALLYHCKEELENNPSNSSLRPGIVHRLDKETTGLLVAAKTSLAHQKLIEMFANREVHKEYLAVCVGNPGNVEINMAIARHPVHRKQMTTVKEGGRKALSICETLAHNHELSLVNVILATGRTHQIRVHMKHQGTPVLGDSTYGFEQANKKHGVSRQLLHAHLLRFNHPISRISLEFKAEVPEDMTKFIKKLCA